MGGKGRREKNRRETAALPLDHVSPPPLPARHLHRRRQPRHLPHLQAALHQVGGWLPFYDAGRRVQRPRRRSLPPTTVEFRGFTMTRGYPPPLPLQTTWRVRVDRLHVARSDRHPVCGLHDVRRGRLVQRRRRRRRGHQHGQPVQSGGECVRVCVWDGTAAACVAKKLKKNVSFSTHRACLSSPPSSRPPSPPATAKTLGGGCPTSWRAPSCSTSTSPTATR